MLRSFVSSCLAGALLGVANNHASPRFEVRPVLALHSCRFALANFFEEMRCPLARRGRRSGNLDSRLDVGRRSGFGGLGNESDGGIERVVRF